VEAVGPTSFGAHAIILKITAKQSMDVSRYLMRVLPLYFYINASMTFLDTYDKIGFLGKCLLHPSIASW
jgi:hypothetical protein